MNETIKHRIEQIKRGEVPTGYKKSKLGVLPGDWTSMTVGECLEKVEKPVAVEPDKLYTQIGIRSHGKGLFYKEPVSGESLGNKSVFWVEPDCFVLNIVFAWEQAIGKTTENEIGMIGSHRFPMFRPIDNRVYIDYLISYLLTKRGTDILEFASPGGAGRNRTLGQDRFLNSKIILPTIDEQKKIAEILATQDKVIALKEKLLQEKKTQKKYLMQQLLTGEKRLPGFSGEWVRTKMSDVLELRNEKNTSEDLRICSVAVNDGVVDQIAHLGKSMAASNTSNYAVVHYGDIVYTKSPTGNFPYGIVKQSQLAENVAVSPLYGVYKPRTYELGFILNEYFSFANNANNYLLPIINKGAKNTINIADIIFLTPSLLLPKDDNEICKLAQVFKKANEEISIIRPRKAKENSPDAAFTNGYCKGVKE